jgi:MFS family permease
VGGAIVASRTMRYGRRKMIIVGCCITIFGTLLMEILNYGVIVLAQFLMYFGGGFCIVILPRFIEETVPRDVYGTCFAIQMVAE